MIKEKREYWRWKEYRKTIEGKDWKNSKIITAGIDIGSISSKAVIMIDGEIYALSIMRTGSNSLDSAKRVLDFALEETNLKVENINYIVGTGYGRVNVPMANKTITEISCHAKGANFIWGDSVRTVLDVGGQDIKAISVDERGNVVSFLMNDKCAAGTGRGMEVIADLLSLPIEEIGDASLKVDEDPAPLNCTCVVFAKSEAVSLLRKGWTKEKILAAYCRAMAQRMFDILKRVGIEKDFVVTGGQSKNIGTVNRLETLLGFKRLEVLTWEKDWKDPVTAGAIGAAIFAKALYEKKGL
jgi:bzd-type benzoyl-CoA reductase Q subunit